MDACQKYGRNSSAFDRVCEEAVESVTNPQPLYDVILVDEAQDFSKYFLQMCYMSLPHESRMHMMNSKAWITKTLNLRKTFLDTVMDGRM